MRELVSRQKFCHLWVIWRAVHNGWIQLSWFLLTNDPKIWPHWYSGIISFQSSWTNWRCLFLYENRDSTWNCVFYLITELYLCYSCACGTSFEYDLKYVLVSNGCISWKALISYWSVVIHQSMPGSSRHWPINAVLSISTCGSVEWCYSGAQSCIW